MDPGRILFDQLAGDAVKELLRAVTGTFLCRSTAERLRRTVEPLLPLVQQGGRHALRSNADLAELAAQLREALDLARRAASSPRWNVYRAAQLARRMEAADQGIARWLARHAPVNVLDGVRRLRDEADARIGRLERRVEEVAAMQGPPAGMPPAMSLPVAPPPCKGMAFAVDVAPPSKGMAFAMDVAPPSKGMAMAVDVAPPPKGMGMGMPMDLEVPEEELVKGTGVLGSGVKVGKEKVKEMVMSGGGGWEVVGIRGMGGSGKTTLAMEIYKDQKVQGNKRSNHSHLA
jgi:hypothetical protein